VISTGVPKIIVVEIKLSTSPLSRILKGIATFARVLNMPEPLVHTTGVFVFANVQRFENSLGKSLCPIRVLRQLLSWLRPLDR
jgi:hypothetical protein